jgi:hypothetical protein
LLPKYLACLGIIGPQIRRPLKIPAWATKIDESISILKIFFFISISLGESSPTF